MIKETGFTILVFSVFLLMGCTLVNKTSLPNAPETFNGDPALWQYPYKEFETDLKDYRSDFKGKEYEKAREKRNMMIDRIRVEIEFNYRQYESELFSNRATFQTGADIFELGLSTAATLTGGEGGKTVLTAIISGVKGSRLSFDKNFFREKTTEIIVSKMRASRDGIKAQIESKMTALPVDQYTFDEAWAELVELYYAGTLQGGLQALAIEAGKSAADAQKERKDLTERKIRQDEWIQINEINSWVNDLEKDYQKGFVVFYNEEFKKKGTKKEELCEKINKDFGDSPQLCEKVIEIVKMLESPHKKACVIDCSKPLIIIQFLNHLLYVSNLYDIWPYKTLIVSKAKVDKELDDLIKQTYEFRKKEISELSPEEQMQIVKLNRLILENTYDFVPKYDRLERGKGETIAISLKALDKAENALKKLGVKPTEKPYGEAVFYVLRNLIEYRLRNRFGLSKLRHDLGIE